MATEIRMPQLGESVHEGTLGKWLKQTGDTVAKYEPLVEVITDKVNVEMPSPYAGVLEQIVVQEGQTVTAGTVIATIRESGASARAAASAGTATASPPPVSPPRTASPARPATPPPPASRPFGPSQPAGAAAAQFGRETVR